MSTPFRAALRLLQTPIGLSDRKNQHSINKHKKRARLGVYLILIISSLAVVYKSQIFNQRSNQPVDINQTVSVNSPNIRQVLDNAITQTKVTRYYDPSYVAMSYPGGDVPMFTGVCTDVVVRAFRQAGVDLQKEVHEDMSQNFSAYPKDWGLKAPDPNIDHRRVPNLMVFFERQGKSLPISKKAANYQPGDIVAWDLGGGMSHIGIVSNVRTSSGRFAIIHNIGEGTKVEDVLFDWEIIGHYRYFD